jgi:hypothetical protein
VGFGLVSFSLCPATIEDVVNRCAHQFPALVGIAGHGLLALFLRNCFNPDRFDCRWLESSGIATALH